MIGKMLKGLSNGRALQTSTGAACILARQCPPYDVDGQGAWTAPALSMHSPADYGLLLELPDYLQNVPQTGDDGILVLDSAVALAGPCTKGFL